ncbi:MAG: VOC family protein [bacterium]|nr:VOC family protein [bacterium]
MDLGAFSLSLNVKDIQKSKEFYEALGFSIFGGDQTQKWLIMRNGDHLIGLFQDTIEKNTITFNPGWDQNAQELGSFTDVREVQKILKEKGITLKQVVDESTSGPGHLTLEDPDGNAILIDQFV